MSKVLIYTVSYQDPANTPEYVRLSVELNKKYAEANDYDFEEFVIPDNFPRHPAWGRVWFLKEALSRGYDHVLYLDGDAFVVNQKFTLNSFIIYMEGVCGLFARDQATFRKVFHSEYPNAGVFLFSASNDGARLADLWWEVPEDNTYIQSEDDLIEDSGRYLSNTDTLQHHPYEQLALWFLWRRYPLSFRFVKVHSELNGADGRFIKHLIQISDEERVKIMKGYM